MINSHGRLFVKINDPNYKYLNEFKFYNYASVGTLNYGTYDTSIIRTKENGIYKLNGISFKPNKSVDFQIKTYMFAEDSLLKYIIDNELTVDIQIHYGKCSHPNNFIEYEKVISVNSAILNNYSLNNLLALTSDESNKIEESVNVSGFELDIFNKPKLYSLGFFNQNPIIKLVKYNDFYIGITFKSINSGADNELRLIYSSDGKTWKSKVLESNLGGNVNPYYFDLHVKNDKIYILSRDVAQNNYLFVFDLTIIEDGNLNTLFFIDTINRKISLGLYFITTMVLIDDFIVFGTVQGNIIKFNLNTFESNIIIPKIVNQINNSCVNDSHVYFACNNGYILKYSIINNSILYYALSENGKTFVEYNYNIIYFINDTLYLGTNNKLYYTKDFVFINLIEESFESIKDLKFVDNNIGYICDGQKMYKTINGGLNWEHLRLNYNIVGLSLYKNEVILYGTTEELGTFRLNSTINNNGQFGNGSLMI